MTLAERGTPAGLISTTAFQRLALGEMAALGASGLPLLVIEHPLGGQPVEGVDRRVVQGAEQLVGLLGRAPEGRP